MDSSPMGEPMYKLSCYSSIQVVAETIAQQHASFQLCGPKAVGLAPSPASLTPTR